MAQPLPEGDQCHAGTVGNGFFESGSLTLDLQRARFTYSDTGAALFSFAPLQPALYAALRTSDSAPLKVSSWGNEVGCETSRLTTALRVGGYRLNGGVLGYCKMGVDIGVPLAGIVGLAGFAGQTIIIDYPSRKWKVTR
ncbi:hypothetical protein [Duganella radicis]|uniref:Aspartyl protease n=1 Tax=Duganella radicis TaxID=551988 RepID=A0A6L6PP45_9BURK|nr:hypothetical protein [Duganella radicis]MTV40381.1 hypothetical protein [Duganella radicis]